MPYLYPLYHLVVPKNTIAFNRVFFSDFGVIVKQGYSVNLV
jgi:hypothetical protein